MLPEKSLKKLDFVKLYDVFKKTSAEIIWPLADPGKWVYM